MANCNKPGKRLDSRAVKDQTRYDPAAAEPRIAELWERSRLFHPDPEGTPDENYSIAIPAPCTWATRSTTRCRTR